jgi:nicotinate-nucleotide adenylyltransferase
MPSRNGEIAETFPAWRNTGDFRRLRSASVLGDGAGRMKTALYGGSFDPIHHGHLILAREAMEQLGLDRVVFIPAAVSPFKLETQPAPPELRLEMVRAAIAGEARFECDDAEVYRPGPSFTVDTVEAWRRRVPGDDLFYFIGQDNVRDLPKWRRWEELRNLVQFVVFERDSGAPPHDFPRVVRRFDVSATEIRKRVAEKRSIRYLVPDAVGSMIEKHRLYQGESH